MNDVEASVLKRLIELQTEDTAVKLLHHRRESLPEALRLTQLRDQLAELDADIEIAERQCSEVARAQSRFEGDIELLDGRIRRDEGRLFSGSVGNPKELSSLQAEVAMLRRQRSELEDGLLEVMVSRDQANDTLSKLTAEREAFATTADDIGSRVEAAMREIEAGLQDHGARRTELAAAIPANLLSLYDRLRETKQGVGAALLVGGACQGCHTRLPAREVERMKTQGGLQRCDNCRRIVVVA